MSQNPKMPDLMKLYVKSCVIGFLAAAVFVAMLMWFDMAGLWGLVAHSDAGAVAVLMLWVAHGIVFAGVQFAYAIMSMADRDDDDDDRGGTPARVWLAEPVRVRSDESRRPRR